MDFDQLFQDILNDKVELNTCTEYQSTKVYIKLDGNDSPIIPGDHLLIVINPKKGNFIVEDKTIEITDKYKSMVDNNLKVMKFRLKPNINLEKLNNFKCLILGSGSVGCNIARNLLGWGIKHITFIDNSNVSITNLSRQTLFMYKDLGRNKAIVAAERLQDILPGFNSVGIKLDIPMVDRPGLYNKEEVNEKINVFEDLISKHDVIFICTDNKESRWFPTLIGKKLDKLVFNVAVGFNSWLAMYHSYSGSPNVSCYFCTSISVRNTEINRSIDQLCTVTHIATTFMSAAAAVDLLVNIIHGESEVSQLRGSLVNYNIENINGVRDIKCCACGDEIQNVYENHKYDIIWKILDHGRYLENFAFKDVEIYGEDTLICFDDSD